MLELLDSVLVSMEDSSMLESSLEAGEKGSLPLPRSSALGAETSGQRELRVSAPRAGGHHCEVKR